MPTQQGTYHRIRVTAAAGLLAFFAVVSARPAVAVDIVDDPVQMDDLLMQVVQKTNSLCWEMHRYHQHQPGFAQQYRAAKEIWSKAAQLRDALAAGPVETSVMIQQANEMNEMFAQLEKSLSQWGPGDQSSLGTVAEPRTVVRPGVGVDLPFIGVRVGSPAVVVNDDGPVMLQRLRVHPNARGSKRSLERELAAAKVAIGYLVEDASVTSQPGGPSPAPAQSAGPTLAPADDKPIPAPPTPGSTLENPNPKPATGPTPLPNPSPK
jgi:hypothetical protein